MAVTEFEEQRLWRSLLIGPGFPTSFLQLSAFHGTVVESCCTSMVFYYPIITLGNWECCNKECGTKNDDNVAKCKDCGHDKCGSCSAKDKDISPYPFAPWRLFADMWVCMRFAWANMTLEPAEARDIIYIFKLLKQHILYNVSESSMSILPSYSLTQVAYFLLRWTIPGSNCLIKLYLSRQRETQRCNGQLQSPNRYNAYRDFAHYTAPGSSSNIEYSMSLQPASSVMGIGPLPSNQIDRRSGEDNVKRS
ncbi:hypothetical protein NA57DRAFT_61932 [Rhizodiscina lignyota]|uniref:RanBP2-type domain-containing protein n=1 Tax=Rhizodiscina lignyota TaxID=1504668 RepID=A0A9P4I7B3_9PEZI|nr:hypothetical protein NA57DRAFT_61932 [Rhizodiscina lignyota]